jgi:hypothetical protein
MPTDQAPVSPFILDPCVKQTCPLTTRGDPVHLVQSFIDYERLDLKFWVSICSQREYLDKLSNH